MDSLALSNESPHARPDCLRFSVMDLNKLSLVEV